MTEYHLTFEVRDGSKLDCVVNLPHADLLLKREQKFRDDYHEYARWVICSIIKGNGIPKSKDPDLDEKWLMMNVVWQLVDGDSRLHNVTQDVHFTLRSTAKEWHEGGDNSIHISWQPHNQVQVQVFEGNYRISAISRAIH